MRLSLLIVVIFLLPFTGCSVGSASPSCNFKVNITDPPPAGWIRVDKRAFQFYIPQSLREQQVQGIDSSVWQYENETLRLEIDYGMYSNFPETLREKRDYSEQIWCINEKKALVCSYTAVRNTDKIKGQKGMGMFFLTENRNEIKPAFWVEAVTDEDIKIARQIFQTVRFQN